jgi:hypothetical protein
MAQLIPTVPGIGAAFGTGVGSGLSKAINTFTEAKIKQMVEAPQNERIAQIMARISGAPSGQPNQAAQQTQPSIEQLSGQQQQQAPQQQSSQAQPELTAEEFAELLKGVPAHLHGPVVNAYQAHQKAKAQERRHQENVSLKREAQTFREVGKPLEELRKSVHRAEKEIPLLEEAIYAFEHGDPGTGPSRAVLGKLGLQDVFTNPTLQLLKQYQQQWSQGASSAYDTGNLTNNEVSAYKDAMFSLLADPKANIVHLKNLLLERKTLAAQGKARRDITRENGGAPPRDILDQIRDRTEEITRENYAQSMKNIKDFIAGESGAPQRQTNAQAPGESGESGGKGLLEQIAPPGGLLDILGRGIPRTFARASESLFGLPGDISSLGLGAANYLTGGATPTYAQVQEKLPISYPTSEQIRSKLKDVTGGLLEPRDKSEELADNIASDFATIALSPNSALASNFAKTVGANVAAFFTKELGGGPLAQTGAKIGFSILAGVPGMRKGLADAMDKSYDAARTAAKGASVETGSLAKQAGQIFDNASKGDSPAKKFLQERAKAVEKVTRNGKASVEELTQLKRDLNQHLRSVGDIPKEAQASVKKLVGGVVDTLKDYGKKNPQFGENFFKAEDIFKGLSAQSGLTKFLDKYISPTSIKSPVVKALIYTPATLHSPIKAAGAAGGAFAAQQLSSTFDLFKASKEARKAYTDLLTESFKNNGPAAARAATKLDKIAQKEGI